MDFQHDLGTRARLTLSEEVRMDVPASFVREGLVVSGGLVLDGGERCFVTRRGSLHNTVGRLDWESDDGEPRSAPVRLHLVVSTSAGFEDRLSGVIRFDPAAYVYRVDAA